MFTSDAVAMPLVTDFFSFFDHRWCLIQMTIVIPYKTYETKDSETYFIRLSFSTRGHLLEAGTFPEIVKKKKESFFKSKLRSGR